LNKKIFNTNKALSQSNEHLLHLTEIRQQQQHKKVPVSYGSLKKTNYQIINKQYRIIIIDEYHIKIFQQ